MLRKAQLSVACLLVFSSVNLASAFTLRGPLAAWQTPTLGYDGIFGPMNLTEEYRYNIRTVTYGFDKTFIDYFGQRGVQEINKAVAILNALPPASKLNPNAYPSDTRRFNSRAAALNVLDLKTMSLSLLLQEMGLHSPERYLWSLRSRVPVPGATDVFWYTVIMRNFDPITLEPSPYVNGTLYTYTIIDDYWGNDLAEALEVSVDPLAPVATAVATLRASYGLFYTGLTRDDVGGLRYIYNPRNYNYENLLPDTTLATAAAWTPVGGTNGVNTNLLVNLALRPGVDKVVFKRVANESTVGWIRIVTNKYSDTYILNGKKRTQKTQRVLAGSINDGVTNGLPDIIFAAGDAGLAADGSPVLLSRLNVVWENNAALNTQSGNLESGPGVIQPSAVITFNNVGPFNFHQTPFLDEANPLLPGFVWGSFDGTTNAPLIYPDRISVEALENMVLSGGN